MIITTPGGGTGTGTVTGPASSVAGDLASFADTSGIVLADSGTRVKPIFSTAVTGASMVSSGTNTVLVGPTVMVTPGADGTYRFTIQVIMTAGGTGGTCTAGTFGVNLSFKDADTGLTYALAATGSVGFMTATNGAAFASNTMAGGSPSASGNYIAFPKEFRAASGVAIQYQVYQGTNSNCTTPAVFTARPALYYMGY